jgi:hypothetical protein
MMIPRPRARQAATAQEVADRDSRLDYSLDSLAIIDQIVRSPTFAGPVEPIAAYVGEVAIREAGGSWWH